MENELQIDEHRLLHYLSSTEVNEACSGHKDFLEWANETEELRNKLEKIGQLSIQPSEKQWDSEYWGEDALIHLDRYPYYGCEIHQCTKCNTVFFYYLELGGHGAQKRYRVVRKELINLESIKPLHRIVIDSGGAGLGYTMYKNPDLTYGISISITMGLGADVYHQLTPEETELYLKGGIKSLDERRKDMTSNYNKYEVTSWR
jgi:hypothetical protein